MATKPQRRHRVTAEQAREQGTTVAQAVASLVSAAIGAERRRNRLHLAALWAAVILSAVLGVVL